MELPQDVWTSMSAFWEDAIPLQIAPILQVPSCLCTHSSPKETFHALLVPVDILELPQQDVLV